ncbi:MAG TPA: hypothetical protein VF331_25160 [Polyangiales bacterium]
MQLLLLVILAWLGSATAWAQASAAVSTTAPPSADELASDAAILRLGAEPTLQETPGSSSKFLYDLRLRAAGQIIGRDPETLLNYDVIQRPSLGPLIYWRTPDLLRPRATRAYPTTMLSMSAEWEVTDYLLLRGLVDTGEIRDGSTLEPPVQGLTINGSRGLHEVQSLAIVRELSVTVGKPAFDVELGRFRSTLAEGLVYDDFGTGARASVDFQELGLMPVRAELLASTVGQRVKSVESNPMLALRVEYAPSLLDTLGFFVAVARDRNGALSDVLRSSMAERVLDTPERLHALFAQDQGHGQIAYLGADTQLVLAKALLLKASAVISGGQFTLAVANLQNPTQNDQASIVVRGAAANAELHYGLGRKVDLAGYAFVLSGGSPPTGNHDTYDAFIGLAPYWVWTGLFFSGGLNQSLLANRAAAAGIHGHGVAGIGPGIELRQGRGLLEMRAIWLQALAAPPPQPIGGTGNAYGLEVDLRAQWNPWRFLGVGAELDVLVPGTYFPEAAVAYRALSMVSLAYGN